LVDAPNLDRVVMKACHPPAVAEALIPVEERHFVRRWWCIPLERQRLERQFRGPDLQGRHSSDFKPLGMEERVDDLDSLAIPPHHGFHRERCEGHGAKQIDREANNLHGNRRRHRIDGPRQEP